MPQHQEYVQRPSQHALSAERRRQCYGYFGLSLELQLEHHDSGDLVRQRRCIQDQFLLDKRRRLRATHWMSDNGESCPSLLVANLRCSTTPSLLVADCSCSGHEQTAGAVDLDKSSNTLFSCHSACLSCSQSGHKDRWQEWDLSFVTLAYGSETGGTMSGQGSLFSSYISIKNRFSVSEKLLTIK